MITYIATNTKTGKFYIGSAKDYCNYMNRRGNHHVRKGKGAGSFQQDLQTDPSAFTWEFFEDELDTREFEESLLAIHVGSELCYNKSRTAGGRNDPRIARAANLSRKTFTRSESCREKMSVKQAENWKDNDERRDINAAKMKDTNSKLRPCPDCGKLMNSGNLTQHVRRQTCKR